MIRRLHIPLIDPEDVIRHLGEQEKHWKAGRSAHALTNLWFNSDGLPSSVRAIITSHRDFPSAELIDAFLERQVSLGTRGRHSQTDLLAVLGLGDQISIAAIEGKAGEQFGDIVAQWLDESEGKSKRLSALCETLGLLHEAALPLRYQLLHRTASAIYEAKRYRSGTAMMIVQSFADDKASYSDFELFAEALGVQDIERGTLRGPMKCDDVLLYLGWVQEAVSDVDNSVSYLRDLHAYADRLSRWCDRVKAWCDQRAE